jgi:hypothetical protein
MFLRKRFQNPSPFFLSLLFGLEMSSVASSCTSYHDVQLSPTKDLKTVGTPYCELETPKLWAKINHLSF